MRLSISAVRRLAIFFFYDKEGIVDDYIPYLLEDLNQNIDELLVVCNGNLTDQSRQKLDKYTSKILIRENKGFDVWAYKEAMELYGWDKLSSYDEIVLLNFTNYGPIYPFKEMFDEMNGRDVDFWGVVMRYGFPHDPYKMCKYGYIPDHISTSFMVLRSDLVNSSDFQEHWDTMPMINNYEESICYHEAIFTEDFKRKGFKADNYINAEDLKEYWDYPLMLYPTELIKNRRCPIFKRKTFYNVYEEFFISCCGNPAMDLYEYLRSETDYDVNMLWDNLLRTVNLWDIKERMQLNYFFSDVMSKTLSNEIRVALMLHVYFEDRIEFCLDYAKSMPESADILITTDTEGKKQLIEQKAKMLKCNKLSVFVIPNRGRDVSALLSGFRDYVYNYDYICFAHDKKVTQINPLMIGEGFAYHCFENILGTKELVNNIIINFEQNPRLGILTPPPPIHANYYNTIGFEWGLNFEATANLASELGLKVDMVRQKPPVAPLGTMFWFRPNALKILFDRNYSYNDFPKEPIKGGDGSLLHAIERIYPFIAQQQGYYSAWGLSSTFGKMYTTNLYYMLRDVHTTFYWHNGIHDRQAMLYLMGHTNQDTKQENFVGHGITKESIDSSEKMQNDHVKYDMTTWTLSKMLVKSVISQEMYNKLVKFKNLIKYR